MYKIEKNVAMIHPKFGRFGGSKYPYADMEQGDSFLVPVDPNTFESWEKTFGRVTSTLNAYCRKTFGKTALKSGFVTRKDKKCNGVRVFRL
jgi:hypothetical protein